MTSKPPLDARLQRLATTSEDLYDPGTEHLFTVRVRLLCPVNPRHLIGEAWTDSTGKIELLPSAITTGPQQPHVRFGDLRITDPDNAGRRYVQWRCHHCDRRGVNSGEPNTLRADRLFHLLALLSEHGPARVKVALKKTDILALVERITAEKATDVPGPAAEAPPSRDW